MATIPPKAPIQVFDSSLNFLGEVDTYESLDHTRGWNKPGPWSCAINWNIFDDSGMLRYASLFTIGGYITIGCDGYKNGIINAIDQPIGSDGKQSQIITVSGTEITGIFNRRLLNAPAGQDVYSLTAPAETVIKSIISGQCGPTALNANRKFPNLVIAANQARGDNYLVSNAYTNLLDEIANCSIATLLGWSIYFDRANRQLVLDCALGDNLVTGQPNNAIFSTDYDTLLSSDLTITNEQYRNLATVTGKGNGAARPVLDVYNGTEPSGFERFETYVNANDKSSTPDLTSKGQAQLGTYKYTSTLEGMCLAKSPLTYGVNYNLGDFVTIEAYDYSLNKQITAIQESWGNLSYELTPTFDKAPATITSQMANSSANLGAQVSKLGVNTPGILYLSNSETGINTPGSIAKTLSGGAGTAAENGSLIVADTATTVYDMTYSGTWSKIELQVMTVIDSQWVNIEEIGGSSFGSLGPGSSQTIASDTTGMAICKNISGQVRMQQNKFACIFAASNKTWSNLIGFSDGVTRWRIKITG